MTMWRMGRAKVYFMVVLVICLGYTFFELNQLEAEIKTELKSKGITIIDYKEPDEVHISESNSGGKPEEKTFFNNRSLSAVQKWCKTDDLYVLA